MSGLPGIQYLTHQQIDKTKWDRCIDTADNGLIYAYSFYLDNMSKHWDAIVLSKGLHSENDYETVMPLTWNMKYGIRYLYQPFLAAQLGIFGKEITAETTSNFIDAIPSSFRLIQINLNSGNTGPAKFSSQRSNYTLSLDKPYEELEKKYNENTRRNIKKAKQPGCSLQKGFEAEKVITLAIQQMRTQGNDEKNNIAGFRKLYQYLLEKKMATTYGISLNDELMASCIFFFSHTRAYYILVGNHPNGRNMGASHALVDAFIKDHAGRDLVLHFEGSDIRSLASFYSGFGAKHETYPALKINRLPFYLRWMKR